MVKLKSELKEEKTFVNTQEFVRLNEVEKFYIQKNPNLTDDVLAEFLNVPINFVIEARLSLDSQFKPLAVDLTYNEKKHQWQDKDGNVYAGPPVKDTDTKSTVELKQQVASGINASNMFARNSVATIMTQGASQVAEMTKPNTKNRLIPSCVHVPVRKK